MNKPRTFILNVFSNIIITFFSKFIGFFIAPIIIKGFGDETYGLYTLILSFVGFISILEFGVSGALVKFVAEYLGKKDYDRINTYIGAGFVVKIVISFFIFIGFLIVYFYALKFFKISSSNITLAKQILIVIVISAIINQLFSSFRSALQGLQLFYILNITSFLTGLINAGLSVFIAVSHFSILYLALVSLFINILNGLLFVTILKVKLPQFKFSLKYKYIKVLKRLFKFSAGLYAIAILNIFIFQSDKIILGLFLPTSAITYYQISFVIIGVISSINSMISSVFVPLVSEEEAKGNIELLDDLKYNIPKFSASIVLPIVIFVFIYSEPIILLWMGENYLNVAHLLKVFVFYWFFITLSPLGAMLIGKGNYKPVLIIYIIGVVINLPLSIIGVSLWGVIGVIIGTVAQYLVIVPIQAILFFKELNVSFKRFVYQVWIPIYTITLIILILAYLIRIYFYPETILSLISQAFFIVLVYYVLFWFFSVSKEEKIYLKRLLPKGLFS